MAQFKMTRSRIIRPARRRSRVIRKKRSVSSGGVKQIMHQKDRREADRFTQKLGASIINTDAAITTAGTQLLLIEDKTELGVGSQDNDSADRTGRMVSINNMNFRFVLSANSAGTATQFVRILVVSTTTNVIPDLASILNGIASKTTLVADWVHAMKRSPKDNSTSGFDGPYTVHYDRLHSVSSVGTGALPTIKFIKKNINFSSGHRIYYAAPSSTDFQKGMFFLFAIQNGASANKPSLSHILTYNYNV